MKTISHAGIALGAFLLIASTAAAQTAAGPRVSLRAASSLIAPSETVLNPLNPIQILSHRDRAQGPLTSAAVRRQITRDSVAGKTANVALAAVIGGFAGLYVGGFAGSWVRDGRNPECFDASVGAPIGTVAGAVLAATYVHRRQR